MGYTWTQFGILKDIEEDSKYLYIINENGDKRKISKTKYKESHIAEIKKSSDLLFEKPIIYRTSQNTKNWSADKWFSAIDIDGTSYTTNEKPILHAIVSTHYGDEPSEPIDSQHQKSELERLKQELEEKDVMIKKLSDSKEEEKAKNTKLQGQNDNLTTEISTHKAEKREDEKANTEHEEDVKKQAAKRLQGKIEIDDIQNIVVRGHPEKEMALRLGVVFLQKGSRAKMKIISLESDNVYIVELVDYQNTRAKALLGINDAKSIFCYSFIPLDKEWSNKFERVMGKGDEFYKNSGKTLEDLKAIHDKVLNADLAAKQMGL